MKKLLTAFLFCLASSVYATPVGPMNYQGRLLDDQGIPLSGSYNFVVKIYNAASSGTLKYQENLSGVAVNDGVYSFKIGLGPKAAGDSEWDINLWQGNLNNLYLELAVNGETLTPRHELTSAPHAYTATLALSAGALGNKTAAEFDNILQGVCVSGQGKWLDKINKCLGVGATVTNETLASMMETPDDNFQNLKLSSVDLTASQFDGADFSESQFKDATVAADGLTGTNLSDVLMDSVVFTGTTQAASAINLTNATFKNMNMSKWNLASATLTNFSAANLSACPAALPQYWVCVAMDAPAAGRYVLLGPGVNLSANSAAIVDTFGANTLDLHRSIFNGLNLSNANLQGISLNKQTFANTNLSGANLSHIKITRVLLDNTNLTNANLSHAVINWMLFDENTTINGTNFSEANLTNIGMQALVNNADFSYAIVEDINFHGVSNTSFLELLGRTVSFSDTSGTIDFSKAMLFSENNSSVRFNGTIGNLNFTDLQGNGVLEFQQPVPASTVFNGGEYGIIGDIGGVTINNVTFDSVMSHTGPGNEEGPILNNVTLHGVNYGQNMSRGFINSSTLRYATFTGTCTLSDSFMDMSQADFTGTDFGNCIASIPPNSNWFMTWCPDGTNSSAGTNPNSCLDGQMTPAAGP